MTTTTLGLGRQFNEDLLKAMAEAGGGNYYLAESADILRSILASDLLGLSATVGRQVRLALRPNGARVGVAEVLNDLSTDGDELVLPDLIGGLPLEIGNRRADVARFEWESAFSLAPGSTHSGGPTGVRRVV